MSVNPKISVSLIGVVLSIALLTRCGFDQTPSRRNQGSAPPPGSNLILRTDDGTVDGAVSFSMDVQPIFDTRCVMCHNPVTTRGALDLTADNSYANLVGQPTSAACMLTVPDSVRVVSRDPQGSMLWLKTRPDCGRCGGPMPFGTPGLGVIAPDAFALIDQWILEGAPNN